VISCACGCGSPTLFTRVAEQVSQGKGRADIASALGLSREYLNRVVRQPPKYVKGHAAKNNPGRVLAARAERLSAAIPVMFDRASSAPLSAYPQTRASALKYKNQAYVTMISAFHTSVAAAMLRPRAAVDLTAPRLAVARDITRVMGFLREQDWESIAGLRAKVGVGWMQDRTWDPRTVSFDGFVESYGSWDWIQMRDTAEEQMESARDHKAAALVMGTPWVASLVRIAMATPQNLTETEKAELRRSYLSARETGRVHRASRVQGSQGSPRVSR